VKEIKNCQFWLIFLRISKNSDQINTDKVTLIRNRLIETKLTKDRSGQINKRLFDWLKSNQTTALFSSPFFSLSLNLFHLEKSNQIKMKKRKEKEKRSSQSWQTKFQS
jgi:hypothetical protein